MPGAFPADQPLCYVLDTADTSRTQIKLEPVIWSKLPTELVFHILTFHAREVRKLVNWGATSTYTTISPSIDSIVKDSIAWRRALETTMANDRSGWLIAWASSASKLTELLGDPDFNKRRNNIVFLRLEGMSYWRRIVRKMIGMFPNLKYVQIDDTGRNPPRYPISLDTMVALMPDNIMQHVDTHNQRHFRKTCNSLLARCPKICLEITNFTTMFVARCPKCRTKYRKDFMVRQIMCKRFD